MQVMEASDQVVQLHQSLERQLDQFLASVEQRGYRTALLTTKNKDDALDVVQEAMLKLVQHYRGAAPDIWPQLFQRILQNCIVDWVRRKSRESRWFWRKEKPLQFDDDGEAVEAIELQGVEEENPAQLLSRFRDIKMIMAHLETLSLRQRQAFLLRAWEGFDVQETAEIMECSVGSVKTHLHRALASMRMALEHQVTPNA